MKFTVTPLDPEDGLPETDGDTMDGNKLFFILDDDGLPFWYTDQEGSPPLDNLSYRIDIHP